MDYRKIYIKIIVNAKKEADKGLRPKRIGDKKYFNEYTDMYCQKKIDFMCDECPLKEHYRKK